MKIHFLKAKHWLLISVMGLFGLTSCEKQLDMYGSPEPNYNDSLAAVTSHGVPQSDNNLNK